MDKFEELKKGWKGGHSTETSLDKTEITSIIKHRRKTQINRIMQYFWASFIYQLIVYALLSHVIVRFWNQPEIVLPSITGVVIFIPFTFMLITRFRKVAVPPFVPTLKEHIDIQTMIVKKFYHFKKIYELFLIPLSALIGVHLCVTIFTDGNMLDHPLLSTVLFVASVLSCAYAIKRENERNFVRPLRELAEVRAQCLD
jgi:hypothetical protein